MNIIHLIVTAIISYLIGSVNFSILLSRIISGEDIRKSGSGNAGATNMLRTYGKKMGVVTLLLDVLKGVIAILVCRLVFPQTAQVLAYVAGVFVALGHNFPLYFGFKGGKGVATSLGVILMLDWRVGLIVLVCAILVMALTKYVSLGSILGGASVIIVYILKFFVFKSIDAVQLICIVILGGLLIIRHHANIKRLINGTENKLGSKKEK